MRQAANRIWTLFACVSMGFATFLTLAAISPTRAQPANFKGKTITVEVGAPPAGALDPYARVIAPFLAKHLAGAPRAVVSNVPGAASVVLARQLYNSAPKDGTVIGLLFPDALVEPLLADRPVIGYDPRKFSYLGSANTEGSACVLRKDAGIEDIHDLLSHEVLIGSTSIASPNYRFPKISNAILGTKFKLVPGYKGSNAIRLAMERNEVQGLCTNWSAIKTNFPRALTGASFARIVTQGEANIPELNAAGVPALMSLAKTQKAREALRFFFSPNAFGVPFVLPPAVPKGNVLALQAAFTATLHDPAFISAAKRLNLALDFASGPMIQKEIAKLYKSPRSVIDTVKDALAVK